MPEVVVVLDGLGQATLSIATIGGRVEWLIVLAGGAVVVVVVVLLMGGPADTGALFPAPIGPPDWPFEAGVAVVGGWIRRMSAANPSARPVRSASALLLFGGGGDGGA